MERTESSPATRRLWSSLAARDWWTVLKRVWDEISSDNVEVMAGGVAFFGALSLFPAIVGLVLLYGLVADPAALERQLTWLTLSLVPLARQVLIDSMSLAGHGRTTFGVSALLAVGAAIWGASRATNALLLSVQAAYDDSELRGFLRQLRLNFLLTAAALFGGAIVLISSSAAPGVLTRLGVGPGMLRIVVLLRWPLLWAAFCLGVGLLYRFAPRKLPPGRKRVVWPGAILATLLWTLMSFGFSFYTARINSYDGTYGPAATFAVFMTWLYLSAYVVIAGAEFNSEFDQVQQAADAASDDPSVR